jgi:predicted transcriptional regulator
LRWDYLFGEKITKKTFETNEQAYVAVWHYHLANSKSRHHFPSQEQVEEHFGIDIRTYDLELRKIRAEIINYRLDDIFKSNPEIASKELNAEFGIGLFNYLKDLSYESFTDLRYAKTGKKTRRKFDTKEEALDAFRSKVIEKIKKRKYTCEGSIETEIGTPASIYGINWREDVLDFVYDSIISQDLKQNPCQTEKELQKKYHFSVTSFFDRKGGFIKYKKEKGILYKSHRDREELLENCIKALKLLMDQKKEVSLQNIQETVGTCLSYWHITMHDIYKKAEIPHITEKDLKFVDSVLDQILSKKPKFSYEILNELEKKIPSFFPPKLKKSLIYHAKTLLEKSSEKEGPFLSVITYSPRGKRTKLYSLKKHEKTLYSRKEELDKKFKIGNRGISRISNEIIQFICSHGSVSSKEVFEHLFEEHSELLKNYEKPRLSINSLLSKLKKDGIISHKKGEGYFLSNICYMPDRIPVDILKRTDSEEEKLQDLFDPVRCNDEMNCNQYLRLYGFVNRDEAKYVCEKYGITKTAPTVSSVKKMFS